MNQDFPKTFLFAARCILQIYKFLLGKTLADIFFEQTLRKISNLRQKVSRLYMHVWFSLESNFKNFSFALFNCSCHTSAFIQFCMRSFL